MTQSIVASPFKTSVTSSPSIIKSTMFTNNKASYGPNIAGIPSRLDVMNTAEILELDKLND